jgi:hypothetical protein
VHLHASPRLNGCLSRIFELWNQNLIKPLQANLAFSAACGLGQQSVDTSLIVFANPQPHHAITAAVDVGDLGTTHPSQQAAYCCQSNAAALVVGANNIVAWSGSKVALSTSALTSSGLNENSHGLSCPFVPPPFHPIFGNLFGDSL